MKVGNFVPIKTSFIIYKFSIQMLKLSSPTLNKHILNHSTNHDDDVIFSHIVEIDLILLLFPFLN